MAESVSIPSDIRFQDITGERFHRWIVLSYAGTVSNGDRQTHAWNCICDCGSAAVVRGKNLKNGISKSCGCYNKEQTSKASTTHGHSKGYSRTPEYATWVRMIERCYSEGSSGYHKYGAKGISVCDQWKSDFPTFLADMGQKPSSKHSIDRIDNSKGYEPDNCRWATASEQAYNRTTAHFVVINGVKMHLKEATKLSPVGESAILRRLQKGWSDEEAVFTPPQPGSKAITKSKQPLRETVAEPPPLQPEDHTMSPRPVQLVLSI